MPENLERVRSVGKLSATALGCVAIGLWSTLAVLTRLSQPVPPFELSAIAFAVAFFGSVAYEGWRGKQLLNSLRQPIGLWILGLMGIPGNIILYFIALRHAPDSPVGVNLVNYLWPLLIVVLSNFVMKERLRWLQWLGIAIGVSGAMFAINSDGQTGLQARHATAYLFAFGSAVCWATYSVMSRRFFVTSREVIMVMCGSAVLPVWVFHRLTEITVLPTTALQWVAVVAMGLGPLGFAYYAWDCGMRKGNARLLASAAFMIPIFSTLLLIAFNQAPFRPTIGLACGLVTGGVVLVSAGHRATAPLDRG